MQFLGNYSIYATPFKLTMDIVKDSSMFLPFALFFGYYTLAFRFRKLGRLV